MPADYQRLSRLLDLSAGNRTITDVGSAATDFESDGGLILASDLDIRGGDIQSTTGALTVTTGSGNFILNPAGVITTSKAVHGVDGTAAAPAITFTSDTDTGLYRSGANTLDVSLGGTRRLGYSAGAFQFKEATVLSSTGTLTVNAFTLGGQITGAGNTITNVAITSITSFTASANLDIGAYNFRAATITADGLTAGRVLFAGTDGVLSDDSDFTFATDTLTVTKIGAFTAAGAIDFDNQNMTNVDIDTGDIASAVVINKSPTITLVGDVTANATAMTNLGNVTITTTIAADSVALGTDTTGDYVAGITGGTGITSSGSASGEGIAHSLSVDASQTQITAVGNLDAGSITSNFGSINNGSSAITTTGTVTTGPLVVGGDISTAAAQDWDLLDNNASALSFDTAGQAGILAIVTTNSSEKVTMSGGLDVTGTSTLATVDINAGAIDGVTIGTNSVVTDFRVGNIKIITNTISSTNSNGNIILDPHGSGIVNLNANVGIGTTSADGLLHLDNGTSSTHLVLEKDADTAAGFLFHEAGSQKASILYTANQHIVIKHEEANMDIIFNVNDGGSDTEVMRIDGDVARVGIGTASPSGKLQVEDSTTVSSIVKSSGAGASARIESQNDQGANSFGRIETFGSTASGSHLGVTKANRTYLYAGGSTSTGLTIGTESDDIITLAQNGTEAFRIDTSRNFGFSVTAFGSSAARVIGIGTGAAPTTSPADMIQLWAEDVASGDARLHVRTESGSTNNLILGNGEVRAASGGLTLTANNGSSAITLTGTITGSAVKDEDNMSSNSASHLATQQSIKAYVDSQINTIDTLAELTDTNITSPADSSLLFYDTANSRWIDNVVSGDMTIADTGVAAISAGVIINADINASAAIVDTKLATIVTADKVSGSAVQLASTSAIEDSTGLRIKAATAGNGIGISSQVLSVNVDDSSIEINSDSLRVKAVGITNAMLAGSIADSKLSTITTGDKVSGSAVQLATNSAIENSTGLRLKAATAGDGLAISAAQVLSVTVDDSSIEINSDTLRIKAVGITNAMLAGSIANAKLANSTITFAAEAGSSDAIALGETFTFTAGEGINTTMGTNLVTIAGEEATATNKGVASFSADNFLVSSGAVTIKDGGVSNDELAGSIANSKLANSSITVSDGSNTSPIALGGTLTFTATANETTVVENNGTVTIGLPNNVTIAGNLTVNGTTTTVNSSTVTVDDPLFALADNNSADAVDIGWYGKYVDSGTKYSGIFRDASDSDKWKIFATTGNSNAAPSTTVDTTSGFTLGVLVASTFEGALTGNVTGNADTATTLATARSIGGVSFNGSADIVPTTIAVTDTTDTSSYVALFESATGNLLPKTDAGITYNAGTGMLTATGFTGPLTGNADTSTTLATARSITATGDISWTVSFNGSANVTAAATIANSAVTLAKMANLANLTVIGNVSGSTAAPAAITILDEDNMSSNSATALATQQSIKYYVDNETTSTIADATDTTITSPADGSLLFYDTTSSKWIDNVVSGDLTIADTGVATIGSNRISLAMMQANSVDSNQYVDASVDFAHIQNVTANSVVVRNANSTGVLSTVQLSDTNILIGDGDGFTAASLSGDVTMTNAGAVTIANSAVSLAKMANIANLRVIGNTSGSTAAPSAVTILDEDNMASNSATSLATQQSIKYYIDNNATSSIGGATDTNISSPSAAHLLLYDGSNSWDNKAMSGDATIDANGAITIAAGAIETAMVNNNVITGQTEITSGVVGSADFLLLFDTDANTYKKVKPDNLGVSTPPAGSASEIQYRSSSTAFGAAANVEIRNDSLALKEQTSSSAAVSGFGMLYARNDNHLYYRQDNGTEERLTGAGTANFSSIKAYLNADLTVATGTATTLGTGSAGTWTEVFDVGAFHDASTNTDRFTFDTTGYFLVTISHQWASNAVGYREIKAVYRDDSGSSNSDILVDKISTLGYTDPYSSSSTVIYVDDTSDYLTVQAYQTSGGNLTLEAGADETTSITIVKLDSAPNGVSSSTARGRLSTATTAISHNTETAVPFNAEVHDTHGYHDNSTNNHRFVVPTTGYYQVQSKVTMDGAAGDANYYIRLRIKDNTGAEIAEGWNSQGTSATTYATVETSATVYLEANQWVAAYVTQTRDANTNLIGGDAELTTFNIYRLDVSNGNSSGVSGGVQLSSGDGGFLSDAANLFWDDSNNRLGIGTNTPTTTLQVNGVATFESYLDFNLISVPSDPATEDARMYLKQVDANNNAIAVKLQKAGSIQEVEITSPGAVCEECGSEDGSRDPIYDFKKGKMVLNLFCGHSYEVDLPEWRRLK